jgi:diadenosine tetraphosphate (Ap4A) HIT family hydrolase
LPPLNNHHHRQCVEFAVAQQGYNIGINRLPAADQTLPHLHIRLILRYSGDAPDPRSAVSANKVLLF